MNELNLPILSKSTTSDINTFIDFWQQFYNYGMEKLYADNINAPTFLEPNIIALYIWKNGTPLSSLKEKSLQVKVIKKLELINSLRIKASWSSDDFHKEFKSVSAVWRIFLMHIIKPNVYPIYDQHVHRAYQYMNGYSTDGINTNIKDQVKLAFYEGQYLPFVKQMNVGDLKKMDEAFFAFGQFLNTGKYQVML